MSDNQILFQTINKKLDIPQTVPARLAKLIKGLTLKERSDRWGYEEVCKWINNEEVAVVERDYVEEGIKPYNFNYEKYYNLESLSMAFAGNWTNAKKHLFRGLVEKNIVQYGEEYASGCMDLKELEDKDVAVFRLIRLLNPGAPLCYKGRIFNDLSAVGVTMFNALPNFDDDIMELFKNGCFLDYLTSNSFDKSLVDFVSKCIFYIKQGDTEFYYAIMYMLSGQAGYEYKDYSFNTLEDLVEYLNSLPPERVEYACSNFLDDEKFTMWIYSQGYTEQVVQWMKIYKGAEW